MPKKISDQERILNFFEETEYVKADSAFEFVKVIMKRRERREAPKQATDKKPRKTSDKDKKATPPQAASQPPLSPGYQEQNLTGAAGGTAIHGTAGEAAKVGSAGQIAKS